MDMGEPVIKSERRGKVLEITLDRPPVHAVNQALADGLYAAFCTLRDDPDLMVGLLTASGARAFSAGWDLKEAARMTDAGEDAATLGWTAGGWGGITEFWDLDKPVICAVNGFAVGGGFELVLACDLILAAQHVEFWLPDMERGFLPDTGAVQRLPRVVPHHVAMDLLYTGRRMSAAEAKHWGFVRDVHPSEELLSAARALADQLAGYAPLPLRALKAVTPEIAALPLPDAMARLKAGKSSIPIYEEMMASDDAKEGPKAFAEKRKPEWKSE